MPLDRSLLAYLDRRRIADASLRRAGEEARIVARDGVLNVVGRDLVLRSAGREVFRHPHARLDGSFYQSLGGMEFEVSGGTEQQRLIVHFVQDVRTPRR